MPPFVFVLECWISFHAEFADVLKNIRLKQKNGTALVFHLMASLELKNCTQTLQVYFKHLDVGRGFFRTCSPVSGRDICRLERVHAGEEENFSYFPPPKVILRPVYKI